MLGVGTASAAAMAASDINKAKTATNPREYGVIYWVFTFWVSLGGVAGRRAGGKMGDNQRTRFVRAQLARPRHHSDVDTTSSASPDWNPRMKQVPFEGAYLLDLVISQDGILRSRHTRIDVRTCASAEDRVLGNEQLVAAAHA